MGLLNSEGNLPPDCRGAQPGGKPSVIFIAKPTGQLVPYRLHPLGKRQYWLCCEFRSGHFGDDRNYTIDMANRRCDCGNYEFKCDDLRYCKHMRAIAKFEKNEHGRSEKSNRD